MAKKKGKLKKTPLVKKAKKASARKAHPKKKAKATPKKKAKALAAKKVKCAPKAQAQKKAPAGKPPKKAVPTKKKATLTKAEVVAKMPEGETVVAEKPVTYPNLRRRVGELLDKLDSGTLQWLHFEMTHPDAAGKIKQAEEATKNFSPLDRPALIQDLTTLAVDEFHLADDPDLAGWLKDENSIYAFLISNKD